MGGRRAVWAGRHTSASQRRGFQDRSGESRDNRTGLEWTIQGARRFPPRARGPPISWIFLELYDIREFREMRVSVGARTYLRGEDLHEGSALKGGEHGARPSS